MNKTARFYCFVLILNCFNVLKNVFSEETSSVDLNFKGKYSSDISNYEIVVPQRVDKDGSFISHLVSHRHSKRSIEEFDFIFYKIPIEGKDYVIELMPNRKLISPGAVVEIHKENLEPQNQKFFNESTNNKKIKDMFRSLEVRKLENIDCHFSGTVKHENTSKAALSTCYGLAGFIQIPKGFYTIEPIAEHDPFQEVAYPHILYKTDGLENSSVCHTMGELTASLVRKRRESSFKLSLPMFVETLIVIDKSLIDHHQDSDCENYVLTAFNMAFNLFHDASAGLMLTLTIVRIIRLETENDEMNMKANSDAEKTLKYFQTWQYELNPGDDSHPNHHDVAVLLTRVKSCYSPSFCGLLGLTTIGKACDPKLSAALCEDIGLRLGYVIAHEIGHLLGADHDLVNSTCNGTDENGLETIMNPHVSLTAQTWSSCSREYFKAFFSSGMGNCFLDEPEEHHFNIQDLLPGVMYNADFQCKHLIETNTRECSMGSTCDSLNCYVPGYACIVTHTTPADGTHCGENMWCHNGKCLVIGERPRAVDGNWGEWSAWSDCSRTCGSGVASSVRNCDKPQPSHGGKYCVGERKRYKICAATILNVYEVLQNISDLIRFISEEVNVSFVGKPCETGRPSFRDIQCGEFNDWIYPEDGKVHTWTAYFFHDDNPCILYCINEEKQVAALRPRVVDGTMCFRGIRDICVGGLCKNLPCDLHFESNAVEDACGICHGDGTGCEFSEGTDTLSKLTEGLTKLVNIPSGTRNIKVEETSPTLAKIIVKDKETRDVYVKGSIGMFNVPGSQAWLGMVKKNQEALNIPGPVTKSLSIWIQRLDNVTVKWSMALPVEQQRKPEFAWDFLRWGPCSAKCGPGTQVSKPSCMEGKAGLVEDSFCAELEPPPAKVRQCEVAKCNPRWMVGDWKDCEQGISKKKERRRVVYCIKPIGEGEGESQIIPDSECVGPKPQETETCENRRKREDTDAKNLQFDSPFKSNISEPKHLKQFAVPLTSHRNNETSLSYPVSSHFKHHFHVLKNSEDSDSNEELDDSQTERKFFPYIYKENFKGQRIRVRKHETMSDIRTTKSATCDFRKTGEPRRLKYKPKQLTKTFKARRGESDSVKRRKNLSQMHIRNLKRKLHLRRQSVKKYKTSRNVAHWKKENENHQALDYGSLDERYRKHRRHRKKNLRALGRKSKNHRKRKRSSRIWRKPKPKESNSKVGKEQNGNSGGYEAKNYLNNLFHDNHPKLSNTKATSTKKPQEVQHLSEKPVIKEGVLVIDKDSGENQEIDLIFDSDEAETKKEFTELPQLDQNREKLTIKGQDVLILFQDLQKRPGRAAFYRSGNTTAEKTEVKQAEMATTESTTTSTTTTAIDSTTATTRSQNPEEKSQQTTTTSETSESDNTTIPKEDSYDCDYDVDEADIEKPKTVADEKAQKKKEKEEEKKRKKEEKKKKKEEKKKTKEDKKAKNKRNIAQRI